MAAKESTKGDLRVCSGTWASHAVLLSSMRVSADTQQLLLAGLLEDEEWQEQKCLTERVYTLGWVEVEQGSITAPGSAHLLLLPAQLPRPCS